MAIGKIASFLSSLSPASEAAATTASADQVPEDSERRATALSEHPDLERDRQRGDQHPLAAQLQTMVSAVRALNDNAAEQGAAVAVSPAGPQLKNAVTALGHLLAAVDAQAMAHGAAAPVREASGVIDAVEAGLAGSQASAEQVMRHLPAHQAFRARETLANFQTDMQSAVSQVREALNGLKVS
ncbi:MAG: hypothetical protein H7Z12_05180 [Rhodospirillaceae bacterium]|nr:hypothetical protein [Rhodospirillales bacterium]